MDLEYIQAASILPSDFSPNNFSQRRMTMFCSCRASMSCWEGSMPFNGFCCGLPSKPHPIHSHVQSPFGACHTILGLGNFFIWSICNHFPMNWLCSLGQLQSRAYTSRSSVQHYFHGLTWLLKKRQVLGYAYQSNDCFLLVSDGYPLNTLYCQDLSRALSTRYLKRSASRMSFMYLSHNILHALGPNGFNSLWTKFFCFWSHFLPLCTPR